MFHHKAQLSIEFITLTVLTVALLAVSLDTLTRVSQYFNTRLEHKLCNALFKELEDKSIEVCYLGEGYSTKVWLERKVDVKCGMGGVVSKCGNLTHSVAMDCACVGSGSFEHSVVVENVAGMVNYR